jgi:NAD+ dependent glucose-6-phosphate dehydrogenase
MKILITGASGYLAGFVVRRLRDQHDLTLTDRVASPDDRSDLPFVAADITDAIAVRWLCAGHDAVVHTAALVRERFGKPHEVFADVMVKGAWNVADGSVREGVKRLVNVSSIIAVGAPLDGGRPYRVGDPSAFHAGDLYYCLSKLLGEEIGRAYHDAHGLSVIHIRPGVIVGDGLNREPVRPADRRPFWFMHVDPRDVAGAIEAALATRIPYGVFQVVARRADASFDSTATEEELGYKHEHNWDAIPTLVEGGPT